jgi:glyceraldehyde-3-phosphate dehydrogenase (NAD(P))
LAKSKIAHVVGTGTIGEPLIGLLADNREAFGLDEVTFHKRTPLLAERGKVEDLVRRGAILAVDEGRRDEFQALGHSPTYEKIEALDRASVVIDCTPAGNQNKTEYYQSLSGPRGFLAQGSEFGFGKMYARGINDAALDVEEDRYLHIVSCNTHNISSMIQSLAIGSDGSSHLVNGEFLCIRRANDISQNRKFVASPTVDAHKDPRFGTHHARDAHDLFSTLGHDLQLHSSAIKLNTQYMHTLHFSITLDREITTEEVVERFDSNPRVALTYRSSANQVFSFGRDHGYFGRILSHAVVAVPSLTVRRGVQVVGFAFTPQDGNPLLSTVAAMLWYLYPYEINRRLEVLRPYLFREV